MKIRFAGQGFLLLVILSLFSLYCHRKTGTTGKVHILWEKGKYVLYRNGAPFLIKGGAGYTHMARLSAIGGNTIRTWDTTGLGAILDEAQQHHLAVIAGFYVPESKYLREFYRNERLVQEQYEAYRQVVQRYRSHPALLMWCLGNEVDFPFRPSYNTFYSVYNRLVDMIHEEDPDHPVTTAIINYQFRNVMNVRMKVPGIDVLSFNIFGDLQQLEHNLNRYSWLWDGPFVISEWGIYSPQEAETTAWGVPIEPTSTTKARQYHEMYRQHLPVNNPRFLGAMAFYWGQKEEVTPTWYSITDENGATTAMVHEMRQLWTDAPPLHPAPPIEYMLLNGKGAADNIIVEPGSQQTAELKMDTVLARRLKIVWKVCDEDFDPRNLSAPTEYNTNIQASDNVHVTFKAPEKEGPYRIYSWLYDDYGNVTTANTPFYVIGKESEKMGTGFPTVRN